MTDLMGDDLPVPDIDTSRPHPARMYDYYIGGKNHFAADRALADAALTHWPAGRIGLRENRRFLGRAVGIWSTFIAGGLAVVALVGWVYEYSRGDHAH